MSATDGVPARPYSLRRRLTVAMLAGFALLLTVMSVGLWSYARSAADTSFDLLLDGAAISILESVSAGPDGPTVDLPNSALEILGLAERDRVFYGVSTEDGRMLTGAEDLPPAPPAGARADRLFFDAEYSGETVRFVRRLLEVPGHAGPTRVVVQVGQTREARKLVEQDLVLKGLVGLVAVAALGILFVHAGIHFAMRPLAGIQDDIQGRDPANLAPLRALPPREIAGLIGAINGFMRRLQTNKDNVETFIADVAHQIRTSLSALNGQLELATEARDAAQLRARTAKAADQAARTIRLTNQLLAHAMVIHRADAAPQETVDLLAITRGLIEETMRAPARKEKGPAPDFEVVVNPDARDLVVTGDALSLREALRNLIDNAVKHAGPAPLVRIRLSRATGETSDTGETGTALVLAVEDNGPGIPEAERLHATERFTRLSGREDGSGLGLAIAKAAALAHAGRLILGVSPEGGLSAGLLLPASLPAAEEGV